MQVFLTRAVDFLNLLGRLHRTDKGSRTVGVWHSWEVCQVASDPIKVLPNAGIEAL